MRGTRGAALLVILLCVVLLVQLGRGTLHRQGPPAFYLEPSRGVQVALGKGFPRPGIHQFSDDITAIDVINMTIRPSPLQPRSDPLLFLPLRKGELLIISERKEKGPEIIRLWMPAGQRVALGIPLHPDRMSREDWPLLPGIGPRTAEVIEKDRQKNGDFHTLNGLARVKGIGPRRIASWRQFFSPL